MYKESRFNILKEIDGELIIYNTVSKAFLRVKEKDVLRNALEILNENRSDSEKYQVLIKNGFIVPADKDEVLELKYIFNKRYFNENTLSVGLMPSMACNFACPYCFEEPYRENKVREDYFSILKRYAEKYFRYYNHVDVNLFGGEPLLFFDEIKDYLEYVSRLADKHKFAYSSSIITNGSLITNEVMDVLVKHNCTSMQITIDGSERTHDQTRCFRGGAPSFIKLIEIINKTVGPYLNDSRLNFILRINLLNNTNEEVIEGLTRIDAGIRDRISVFFRRIYDTSCFKGNNNNSSEDYLGLLKSSEKLGFKVMYNKYFARSCEACSDTNFAYITPDLALWKCLNAKDCGKDVGKIGQIMDDGSVTFYANRMVEWYKAANCFENEKCLNCKQLPDCLGGCIAHCALNACSDRICSEFNLTSLPFLYAK